MEKKIEKDTRDVSVKEFSGLVDVSQDPKVVNKPNKITLNMQRERDREPVKGVFKYFENPGGTLKFSVKLHKGDQVETWELADGGIYTLPRGVATHINKNTYYPVYERSREAREASGIPELKVKSKIFRAGFFPLDFVDVGESEQQSQIVTVEK